MPDSTPEVLQQQIEQLQRQLDAARTEGGKDASAPYERQEVHAAIGEQIRQQVPNAPAPSASAAAPADVPSYQDPALAPQVQALVNTAFTQGIQQAVSEAAKTGNAALMDALHDVLADQLHAELLARQKIAPAV